MLKRLAWCVSLFLIITCATYKTPAHAETLQSSNYKLDESFIGDGDLNQSSSTSYQTTNASGDLSIGNTASSSYQVEAGSKTTPFPSLSFIVNGSGINFDSFSSSNATVTNATFSVSNYTSYGYVVQIVGDPPTNNGHTIGAMTTTGNSQVGIEQFGINLVANTLPVAIGANPDNGQFGFGAAAPNYNTPNNYRYVSGETIALAPKSSGVTIYTISYLVNVATLTPGGQYSSHQTLIVTGTY